MGTKESLRFTDLCHELKHTPQFVLDLAENAEDAAKYYQSFARKKKSGEFRYINASQGDLKQIQRRIHHRILSKFDMPEYVHGCVKKRSIVSNAAAHVRQEVVCNLDLDSFFPSITSDKVREIFEKTFCYDEETTNVLTKLTTFRGYLPIGAPSSPALANIAALPLDAAIRALCRAEMPGGEFSYSRYVDDITISGADNVVNILPRVIKTIEENGFKCKESKTKILRRSTRQWVTGVVVNEKLNAPRKLVRKIRQMLYYCQRWGLVEHCETHNIKPHNFLRKINGYVSYLRLTQPLLADIYAVQVSDLAREVTPTKEERKLSLLKAMITDEEIAQFWDHDTKRTVIPITVGLSEFGVLEMTGLELSPEQELKSYVLAGIRRLRNLGQRN